MEDAFLASMQALYEQLATGRPLEEAFGTVLTMANMQARLAAAQDGGSSIPHTEILVACERKLGESIVQSLKALRASRKKEREKIGRAHV